MMKIAGLADLQRRNTKRETLAGDEAERKHCTQTFVHYFKPMPVYSL